MESGSGGWALWRPKTNRRGRQRLSAPALAEGGRSRIDTVVGGKGRGGRERHRGERAQGPPQAEASVLDPLGRPHTTPPPNPPRPRRSHTRTRGFDSLGPGVHPLPRTRPLRITRNREKNGPSHCHALRPSCVFCTAYPLGTVEEPIGGLSTTPVLSKHHSNISQQAKRKATTTSARTGGDRARGEERGIAGIGSLFPPTHTVPHSLSVVSPWLPLLPAVRWVCGALGCWSGPAPQATETTRRHKNRGERSSLGFLAMQPSVVLVLVGWCVLVRCWHAP